MLLGNYNPLSSPRETRTPIFDPASFNGKKPTGGLAMKAQKDKTMYDVKIDECRGSLVSARVDGRESGFSSQTVQNYRDD